MTPEQFTKLIEAAQNDENPNQSDDGHELVEFMCYNTEIFRDLWVAAKDYQENINDVNESNENYESMRIALRKLRAGDGNV